MTEQWRPQGWNNQFSKAWDETRHKDFEAGADAMLEALKQKGHHEALIATDRVGISYNPLTGRYVQTGDVSGKGTWVFIPEG